MLFPKFLVSKTKIRCIISLKLTANAPENGWLEEKTFLLGFPLFSGAFAVSFREAYIVKIETLLFFLYISTLRFLPFGKL